MRKVILAAVIALTGTTTFAQAGPEDLRVGSFSGTWCGYKATFELTSKNDAWEFNGKIRIEKTGEYDRLFIRQNNNDSLRIIRYLSGANTGSSQNVLTFPPQVKSNSNGVYATFAGASGGGPGCKNAPVLFILTP